MRGSACYKAEQKATAAPCFTGLLGRDFLGISPCPRKIRNLSDALPPAVRYLGQGTPRWSGEEERQEDEAVDFRVGEGGAGHVDAGTVGRARPHRLSYSPGRPEALGTSRAAKAHYYDALEQDIGNSTHEILRIKYDLHAREGGDR